jgi:Chalcone isomerase like
VARPVGVAAAAAAASAAAVGASVMGLGSPSSSSSPQTFTAWEAPPALPRRAFSSAGARTTSAGTRTVKEGSGKNKSTSLFLFPTISTVPVVSAQEQADDDDELITEPKSGIAFPRELTFQTPRTVSNPDPSGANSVSKRFFFSGAGVRTVKILGVVPFQTYTLGVFVRPQGSGYRKAYAFFTETQDEASNSDSSAANSSSESEADTRARLLQAALESGFEDDDGFFGALRGADTEKVFRIVPVRDIDGPHMQRALEAQLRPRLKERLADHSEEDGDAVCDALMAQLEVLFAPTANFPKGSPIDIVCLRNGLVLAFFDGVQTALIRSPDQHPTLFIDAFADIYLGPRSVIADAKPAMRRGFFSAFVEEKVGGEECES